MLVQRSAGTPHCPGGQTSSIEYLGERLVADDLVTRGRRSAGRHRGEDGLEIGVQVGLPTSPRAAALLGGCVGNRHPGGGPGARISYAPEDVPPVRPGQPPAHAALTCLLYTSDAA